MLENLHPSEKKVFYDRNRTSCVEKSYVQWYNAVNCVLKKSEQSWLPTFWEKKAVYVVRSFEKEDFLKHSRILSCFVKLKNVLLNLLCVFEQSLLVQYSFC